MKTQLHLVTKEHVTQTDGCWTALAVSAFYNILKTFEEPYILKHK